jgi:hypothetical protein
MSPFIQSFPYIRRSLNKSMKILKQRAPWIVTVILVFFLAVSLTVSYQESTTMDEKAHIPASYSYIKALDMRINPEHPPLLKDLAGLSLLALRPAPISPLSDPLWESGDTIDHSQFPEGPTRTWGLAQWTFGDKLLHENNNNADAITFWSRLPFTLLALVLGVAIYLWTKELAGVYAGLFALVLYAFDPNIIAHSHYVTTDLGIAAFVFFSTYFFVKFLKAPNTKNVVLSGIFLGLAQLTKFSAVLLFPLFGLLSVVYAVAITIKTSEEKKCNWAKIFRSIAEYVLKYAGSVVACFLLIWAVYAVNVWNMPGTVIQEIARVQFPNDKAIGRIAEAIVVNLSAVPFLKPLGEYFLGVFMVFARVAGGNTYYFLGEVSNHASPAYFPVVFLLKETLPFLFLIAFSLLYALFRIGRRTARESRNFFGMLATSVRGHIAQYSMLSFILLYSYLSITGNLNIGIRHLFPILPFLYVLTAKTIFDFIKRRHDNLVSKKVLYVLVGVFIFWVVTIPLVAYPSYLSYFNPVAGGPENGYKYVTDSNYDWGQDLKRLRWWVDDYNQCVGQTHDLPQHQCNQLTRAGTLPTNTPIEQIRIDYFGGSNPKYYFGDSYIPWHGEAAPQPGWYAVSAGFFQESIYKDKKPGDWSYAWLAQYPMVARAGDSIFIFYVSPESLAAPTHTTTPTPPAVPADAPETSNPNDRHENITQAPAEPELW